MHWINVVIYTPETACLNGNLPLSFKFSTQDEAMDIARSAPQGAHYYANFFQSKEGRMELIVLRGMPTSTLLLISIRYIPVDNSNFDWELKREFMMLRVKPTHIRPTFFIPRWIKHLCILYQVCDERGATSVVGLKSARLLQGIPIPMSTPAKGFLQTINSRQNTRTVKP